MSTIPNDPILANAIRFAHLRTERAIHNKADIPRPLPIDDFPLPIQDRRIVRMWITRQTSDAFPMQVEIGRHPDRDARKEPGFILFEPLGGLVPHGK